MTAERTGLRLWETATGRKIRRLTASPQSWYYAVTFAPDGRTLAATNSDTTVLIWAAPPAEDRHAAAPLTSAELPGLWDQLASEDAAQAFAGVTRLIRAPQVALPFLRDRVRPVTAPSADRLRHLIADLDDNRFAVRERASGELAQLGELAEPALRRMLEGKPPPEACERVQAVLARRRAWSGDRLRQWRVVQALEGIGTREAESVLRTLAGGAAASRLTQEAQAALGRLGK